jgi:hypothetical protein
VNLLRPFFIAAVFAVSTPALKADIAATDPDVVPVSAAEKPAKPGPVTADDVLVEDRVDVRIETGGMFDINNINSYSIVPTSITIGWQLDENSNEGWNRGNTEFDFSGFYDAIINGPEDQFVGASFGPRYNFVQPGWSFVPYIECRGGFCFTNATGQWGAQGQDFCFTFLIGTGVRYIINEHCSVSLSALYQHVSNGGLSEPEFENHGLEAVGPQMAFYYKF